MLSTEPGTGREEEPLTISGRVIWKNDQSIEKPAGCGAGFIQVGPEVQSRLRRRIAAMREAGYET